MALPFIVGPHQCSLTQSADGRPQVEVVLRLRLPLAEFFDALLLTLANQHPLFPRGEHEPTPANKPPSKAGLLAPDRGNPTAKTAASPKHKMAGRVQPKKPAHPGTSAPPADPVHDKLLTILSQAGQSQNTDEQGGATASTDPLPAQPEEARVPLNLQQTSNRPPQQAKSSGPSTHHYITQENVHYRVTEDGTYEHMPPPRAFAHPKKCPVQ